MSEQNRISQPLSREELNEVVKDYLIDKLRDFLSVVFVGAISTPGSRESEEVEKKNNTELLNMTAHDGYFTEVIAEIIRRLENGTMRVQEVASGREIEEFGMNPDEATFLFINDVVACHLNFLALMAGQIVQRAGENARVQMPPMEDLAITIKDLDEMGLIHRGELSLRIRVPSLVEALKEGIKSHSWTVPPPQSVVPVSPGRVDAKAKTELAIPTPVPQTQNSAGVEDSTARFRDPTIPAMPAPPADGSAPGAPGPTDQAPESRPSLNLDLVRDSAPEIFVHNDPNGVFASVIEKHEKGETGAPEKKAAPPSLPKELIREDAENPDNVIMPVAVLTAPDGLILEEIPLYDGRYQEGKGKYAFRIGTDPRNDVVIGEEDIQNIDPFHATIFIDVRRRLNATTREKPIPVVKFNEETQMYHPAGGTPVLASERLLPENTALAIGGVKYRTATTVPADFKGVILEVKTDVSVSKEELKKYFAGRLAKLFAKRAQLMEQQGALIMSQPLHNLPIDPEVWELDRQWNEIVHFDQAFKIGAIDVEDLDLLMKSTFEVVERQVEAAKAKLVEANQVEIQRIATARLAAEKMEEVKKDRERKIRERCQKEGLTGLHILPHEDPETVEIVHSCPVFEVRGTTSAKEDIPRTYAFLIPGFSIGKHESNVVELYETDPAPKKDNKIHDFMADISYDPVTDVFMYHRREGETRLVIEGSLRRPMRYTFPIEVGQKVRVGRYLLEVKDKKTGFSPEALYRESNELVDELLEKIFDKSRTSDADDRNAHMDIRRIFMLPLPSNLKREMAANVQRKYETELRQVLAEAGWWNAETPRADAELIRTLKMLIDFGREPKSFLPDCGIDEENLRNLVAIRRDRYMSAGKTVYGRKPAMVWMGEKFSRMGKMFDKKTGSFTESVKKETPVAGMGAIEIARFMEMGLSEPDELSKWNAPLYVERIKRIRRVRELVDVTRNDYAKQLEAITELMEISGNLTMGEVFTNEEIAMKGIHVEIKLTSETEIRAYVQKVAKFIGRKAYRKLGDKTQPDEMECEAALIKGLFELNLITMGDILDYGETPEHAMEKLLSVETRAIESRRRLSLEAVEHASIARQEAALRTRVEEERMNLVLQAEDARKRILEASAGAPDAGTLEELMGLAPVMTDAAVKQAMAAHGMKIQGMEREVKHITDKRRAVIEGRFKFVTTQVEETWDMLQEKWRTLLVNAASACVTQAVTEGLDAYYIKKLIYEGVGSGLMTMDEIGATADDLEKGVAVEKRKRYEKTAYAKDLDDMSFLEAAAFGGIGSEAEKSEFEQCRVTIARQKLELMAEMVQSGKDAYYMKKVAEEIAGMCPEAGEQLLPELKRVLLQ